MNNILIICDSTLSRCWEHQLLTRLEAAGHAVAVRYSAVPVTQDRGLDRILGLESRRFGKSLASRCEPLPQCQLDREEIVIDLTGGATRQDRPVLTIRFSGQESFAAGVSEMLASGKSPELTTLLDGVMVGRARPMLGDRVWLSRAGTDLLAGAISLIEQSVARFFAGRLEPLAEATLRPAPAQRAFMPHYLPFLFKGLAGRVAQKVRLRQRPFYWQTAYRLIDGPGVAETGRLDGPAFTVLPDDGERFYADPFVVERDGRHYLFLEEFPYATGKGIISVTELRDDGSFGVPKVVLEEPHHLSYPQVFEQGGEVFMIPESSGGREMVLYRAEQFPDRWVRDTVLLADIDFNDATLLEAEERYWLIGTQRFGQGSASDTMAVYSAPALRGPWSPHRLNPIAIDHSAARPGGAFIRQDSKIMLPVQDGSRAYGGGLGLMELVRIDEGDVVFGPVGPIGAGPAWARSGIHTLNRVGRLEVVDSAG